MFEKINIYRQIKMKKTVGCFTEEKLNELAAQDNVTVMKPTYDTIFEPWPSQRVSDTMDAIVKIATINKNSSSDDVRKICETNKNILEFSQKYSTMYSKLTDPLFVQDTENLKILKKMILLKAAVDNNMTTKEEAQAQASDIALKSLASRAHSSNTSH